VTIDDIAVLAYFEACVSSLFCASIAGPSRLDTKKRPIAAIGNDEMMTRVNFQE
jgi:hypothetical protein